MSLILEPSTREKPTMFVCSKCGQEVRMTLHKDIMEGGCCGEWYVVAEGYGVWNCCSVGYNSPGGRKEQLDAEWERTLKDGE